MSSSSNPRDSATRKVPRSVQYLLAALFLGPALAAIAIGIISIWHSYAALTAVLTVLSFLGLHVWTRMVPHAPLRTVGIADAARTLGLFLRGARRIGLNHPMHFFFDDEQSGRYCISVVQIRPPASLDPAQPDTEKWPSELSPVEQSIWRERATGDDFRLLEASRERNEVVLASVFRDDCIWRGTGQQLMRRFHCIAIPPDRPG